MHGADPSAGSWDALGVLVRHPFKVAETLPGILEQRRGLHKEIPEWFHEDPVLNALRYWVETFEAAQAWVVKAFTEDRALFSPVVRVDSHYEDDMKNLCFYLGVPFKTPNRPPKSRKKRWSTPTWRQWFLEDPDYAQRGGELVRDFELDEP